MTTTSITLSPEAVDDLVDLIEKRLRVIGHSYQANGRNLNDDLEIARLKDLAQQMNRPFVITVEDYGFSVVRQDDTLPEGR